MCHVCLVDVALRADQLTVARGRVGLLSDFSLLLRSGETVHLVGANGSGKSSLLRVLAGVVEPRRGSVTRAMPCAYVPEPLELPGALPAQRWLRICRSQVGLPAELARRCGKLSKGQLQRLVILTALADAQGRRALFILDEPWSGLDRDSCARLDNELAAAAARGCAVLYTDHSGATTLANTRTISLTHGGGDEDSRPSTVVVALVRGDEQVDVSVLSPELAGRLAEGWKIDGAKSVP